MDTHQSNDCDQDRSLRRSQQDTGIRNLPIHPQHSLRLPEAGWSISVASPSRPVEKNKKHHWRETSSKWLLAHLLWRNHKASTDRAPCRVSLRADSTAVQPRRDPSAKMTFVRNCACASGNYVTWANQMTAVRSQLWDECVPTIDHCECHALWIVSRSWLYACWCSLLLQLHAAVMHRQCKSNAHRLSITLALLIA